MYLFGRNKLRKLISDHLGNRRGQSPFSSWTACLSIALAYTESHPQAIIAVVDLQKLTMVAAYPVVELLNVGLANILFPEEYLLFGRVEGIGFSVLPCESWPITTPTDDFVKLPQLSLTLVELFRACLNVARPLGPDLILPFAAALVSFPGMCENYLRCYRSASRSHAGQLAKTKVSSTCNNPDELSANDSGLNNNTSSMTDDSSGNSEADVALSIERNVDEELSLLFRQDDNMTTEDHRSIQEFFDTFPAAYDSGIGHQQVNMTTSRFETLSRSTIDDMLQALEGIEIPHDYSLDPRIIGDNAYVAPFAEVRDWIMLLRVISQARWGRGGRRRASAVPE